MSFFSKISDSFKYSISKENLDPRNPSGATTGLGQVKTDLKLTGLNPADRTSSTYASDAFAALTRQQWSDYMRDIAPYEDKLIDFANSTTAPGDAQARASADINNAFDRQQGATSDRLRSLGLTLNADEQQAQAQATGLARSLADVQAQNQAGAQTRALQQGLLGNPTPSIKDMS